MHRYYLDESGNTGDLIKPEFSLQFGGQPLFALSCVGVDDEKAVADKLSDLKLKYGVENELKSTEIYAYKPEFFLELAKYLVRNRVPIFVELVDKKFCIITNLISSLIIPFYGEIDEKNGHNQYVRNHLADYMWHELPPKYLELFNKVCLQRQSVKVIDFLSELKAYFDSTSCSMLEKRDVSRLLAASIDEFQSFCLEYGDEEAVESYLPIPDILNKSKRKSKAKKINILPHVHSFFNIIGRLNKYHLGNVENIVLMHDEQRDFDVILGKSKEYIVQNSISKNTPPTPNSDLDIHSDFRLEFVNSNLSSGVQVADLIAGFYARFINDAFYERKRIGSVYVNTFNILVEYQKPLSPLGVNFVLPHHKQQSIFTAFGL
ncbi:TPA: DUF3800 domain-containing protein [Photobacterium damselae subsp. damselae]